MAVASLLLDRASVGVRMAGLSARKTAAFPGDGDGGDGDRVAAMEPSCCSVVVELSGPIFGPAGLMAPNQRVAAELMEKH